MSSIILSEFCHNVGNEDDGNLLIFLAETKTVTKNLFIDNSNNLNSDIFVDMSESFILTHCNLVNVQCVYVFLIHHVCMGGTQTVQCVCF